MKTTQQQTLGKEIKVRGVGLHSGQPAEVILRPLPADSGVVLERMGAGELPLGYKAVKDTTLCTQLYGGLGASVRTVEHLFAALHALHIDNVKIEVTGPEVPILDGSSLPWVMEMQAAGIVQQQATRTPWTITAGEYTLPEGVAVVTAAETLNIEIEVEFPVLGKLRGGWEITPDIFAQEIAGARTFCLMSDVEKMRAAGLIKGGSLECAVVFNDDGTPANPEGLRFPDEPLRHKVLDAVGDLYVGGRVMVGSVFIPKPGHRTNNVLLRKLTHALEE